MMNVVVLSFFVSWAPGELESQEQPVAVAPARAPAAAISQIDVPVTVPIRELESVLDAELAGGKRDGSLFSRSGIPIDQGRVQVEVLRNGPLALDVGADGRLLVALPLRLKVRGDWEVDLGITTIKHHEDVSAELSVHAALALDVGADWVVRSRTLLSFSWAQKPELKVGPLRISLGSVAGAQLDKLLAKAGPMFDEAIARKVPLRAAAERAWQAMDAPVRLSSDPDTWLAIDPLAVSFSGLGRRGDALVFMLGLQAHVAMSVGPQPATVAPKPLPALGVKAPT